MNIIIIGAGAAGLMAAKQLAGAGLKVVVLEARDRLGGRINTFKDSSMHPFEGGAEFIHGNLELTLQLLKEAGIEKQELSGEMWQVENGKWARESEFFRYVNEVMEKLKQIEDDMSIETFLEKSFLGHGYEELRKSLTSYVEGYYSGEISKTSAKSFLKELLSEDEQQYRPADSYGDMVQYLAHGAIEAGADIRLSTVVKEIRWKKDHAEIIDESGHFYHANKVIITVPLGVWTADENAKGAILYTPALDQKREAAKQMGFGAVIKVLLKFKEDFFNNGLLTSKKDIDLSKVHMVLTDNSIPTWWTQHPEKEPLLTGWLSGPKAARIKDESDETILLKSLQSLQAIFQIDIAALEDNLEWSKIFNWTTDPYTRGSYSYSTLHTPVARKILMEPVDDTLFFAGEALYEGPEMGTVEAALTSGKDVVSVTLKA